MQPWQDGWLTRSLLLGFEQSWPVGRPPFSLLALGTFSSSHPYSHSHCLLYL